MATSKTVAKKTGTALVDHGALLKALAEKQAKAAAALSSGSTWASFRGGQLTIDGATMPENKARIVVLATMQERAYYPGAFDPDNKQPPVCYAFGEVNGGAPETPHEKSSDQQHGDCRTCPHAQFGSAERGRGQACRQSQRIAFVASDNKTEGEGAIYQAKIPPTSLKNVKGWLDEIAARELASVQVVSELKVTPDPKNQLAVHLRVVEPTKPGPLNAVLPRIAAAEKMMHEPYPELEEAPKPTAKKRKYK